MKFWVGVTDNTWYRFLSGVRGIDEVNFWHPSGRAPFGTLPEGAPFLFKLKSPNHHIAGGGFFVKDESLPLPLAWDAFGEKTAPPAMTLDRQGAAFGQFTHALFKLMLGGVPLPEAWKKLIPKPGQETATVLPSLIYSCETGPVALGR